MTPALLWTLPLPVQSRLAWDLETSSPSFAIVASGEHLAAALSPRGHLSLRIYGAYAPTDHDSATVTFNRRDRGAEFLLSPGTFSASAALQGHLHALGEALDRAMLAWRATQNKPAWMRLPEGLVIGRPTKRHQARWTEPERPVRPSEVLHFLAHRAQGLDPAQLERWTRSVRELMNSNTLSHFHTVPARPGYYEQVLLDGGKATEAELGYLATRLPTGALDQPKWVQDELVQAATTGALEVRSPEAALGLHWILTHHASTGWMAKPLGTLRAEHLKSTRAALKAFERRARAWPQGGAVSHSVFGHLLDDATWALEQHLDTLEAAVQQEDAGGPDRACRVHHLGRSGWAQRRAETRPGRAPLTLELGVTRTALPWQAEICIGGVPLPDPDALSALHLCCDVVVEQVEALASTFALQHPDAPRCHLWGKERTLYSKLNPVLTLLPVALQRPELAWAHLRNWRALQRELLPHWPPVLSADALLTRLNEDEHLPERYRAALQGALGPERAARLALLTHGPAARENSAPEVWTLIEAALRPDGHQGEALGELQLIAQDTLAMHAWLRPVRAHLPLPALKTCALGPKLQLLRGARVCRESGGGLQALHNQLVDLSRLVPRAHRPDELKLPRQTATRLEQWDADLIVTLPAEPPAAPAESSPALSGLPPETDVPEGGEIEVRARAVSASELSRVAKRMQNCAESYATQVRTQKSVLVELHFPERRDNVLVEFVNQRVRQASGRKNSELRPLQQRGFRHYLQVVQARGLLGDAPAAHSPAAPV